MIVTGNDGSSFHLEPNDESSANVDASVRNVLILSFLYLLLFRKCGEIIVNSLTKLQEL